MRRDSNDKKWQQVKEIVRNRDKTDRILKAISTQEYLILKKNAKHLINVLDPAHYIPVSKDSSLCYKSYNIVLLNRYSHTNLDYCKHPITGENITKEEVQIWWEKILKTDKDQYMYLKHKGLI